MCAYIADNIYSPALMCITLAVNFFTLPNSLALSDAMRWSIALGSCAMLSIEINLEPCQIEYVIVIFRYVLRLLGRFQ